MYSLFTSIRMTKKWIAVCAAWACTNAAFAHIVLENRSAEAGSVYKAVFQVGHGCAGSATTAVQVQIPAGFQAAKPYAKAGWSLATQKAKLAVPYELHGKPVTEDVAVVIWKSEGKALPDGHFDEFILRGKLPGAARPLWFKVVQSCEQGANNWVEVPASGTSTADLKFPAALLQISAAGGIASVAGTSAEPPSASANQPVQVTNAWVRATVPGQKGSGAFMTLTAKTATRLVGAASPVAGVAEVHEMAMEGTIMRMRSVTSLDLPAGKAVELKPGGFHLMLMDLKQTLTAGSTVPITLQLQDAKGVKSTIEVKLPVSLTAPGAEAAGKAGSAAAAMDHSKH